MKEPNYIFYDTPQCGSVPMTEEEYEIFKIDGMVRLMENPKYFPDRCKYWMRHRITKSESCILLDHPQPVACNGVLYDCHCRMGREILELKERVLK